MNGKQIEELHTRIMARISKVSPEHPKDSDDAEMTRVLSDSSMLLLDFLMRQERIERSLEKLVNLQQLQCEMMVAQMSPYVGVNSPSALGAVLEDARATWMDKIQAITGDCHGRDNLRAAGYGQDYPDGGTGGGGAGKGGST